MKISLAVNFDLGDLLKSLENELIIHLDKTQSLPDKFLQEDTDE